MVTKLWDFPKLCNKIDYYYYYYYYVIWTVQLQNENVWLRRQCEVLMSNMQQLTEERNQLQKERDELRACLQQKRLTYL